MLKLRFALLLCLCSPLASDAGWELLSGKFAVLAGMLELLRTCTRDRIVIVSNYTQTLDLVSQVGAPRFCLRVCFLAVLSTPAGGRI